MVQNIGGGGLGRCDGCIDGGVVAIRHEFRVDLVENHTGGMLAELFDQDKCVVLSFK